MSEQIEDDFWAEERARDTAARGRQTDPGACGTCRTAVEAGEQVEHDGCAQRATLIQAPDHPSYELITGLSEEELAALPPRFHVPAYMESSSPQMWVCAVCWGDGWVTGWPCKTAVKHGLRVFTPEHEAETVAKRQAAELAAANARVAELELELKKYVGAEPTIADEMAHLNRCIDAVDALQLPEKLKVDSISGDYRNGYIHALADMRTALESPARSSYPPALPWAQLMDDEDLSDFLAELEHVTTTPGATPSEALAAVEEACGTWRLIAETQHAHNTAAGPNAEAGEGQ